MLGAQGEYAGSQRWQLTIGTRYQKSDRHFRGTEEQEERQAEGSEVVNRIHQPEMSLRYNLDSRWSVSLGVPVLMATRSSPIRDGDREVVARSVTQARGLGDVTLSARRWMADPAKSGSRNVSVGLGLKLPTGANNVTDTRTRLDEESGEFVDTIETVDQSIQPGDGGFGVVADVFGFQRFASDRAAFYFSGTYLANPAATSGVKTYRSRQSEAVMSVADQYLARAGVAVFPGGGRLGLSLGGRIEGVPVEDLVGSSDGFRRPGYAITLEPGATFAWRAHLVSLAVPVALARNRQRSVPDKLVAGRHGDAAFADYVILVGYSRRF